MVNTDRKCNGSYIRFGDDIKNEDIDTLVGIVEWVLDGAPEEEEPEEEDE